MKEKLVIAIFGEGGRETSIILSLLGKLNQSFKGREKGRGKYEVETVLVGGSINPQVAAMCRFSISINENTDPEMVVRMLKERGVNIAIIGSEKYFYFTEFIERENDKEDGKEPKERRKIGIVGPVYPLYEIETDKAGMIGFAKRHEIPIPESAIFRSPGEIVKAVEFIHNHQRTGVAIKTVRSENKATVKISGIHLAGFESEVGYASELLQNGETVVIQEKCDGIEFVLHMFIDANGNWAFTPVIIDNKHRLEDENGIGLGDLTGSMGSASSANGSLSFVRKEDIEAAKAAMLKAVKGLKIETGKNFQGILYAQFMITKYGILVIEFNARFGDPEALNVLMMLETDFAEICKAIVDGNLDKIKVVFNKNKSVVVKYVVAGRYPEPLNGDKIEIRFQRMNISPGVHILFGGVAEDENGNENSTAEIGIDSLKEVKEAKLIVQRGRFLLIGAEGKNIPVAARIVNRVIKKLLGPDTLEKTGFRPGIGSDRQLKEMARIRNSL